jgi:outer membrane protein assembly factor BamB
MSFFPRRRRRTVAAPLALAGAILALTGCAASPEAEGESVQAAAPAEPEAEMLARTIEERYVIGPTAAREMGYRIDWQYPSPGTPLRRFTVQADSVFTLDANNVLTRLRREEGDRVWRIPVAASRIEEILGITYLPEDERVYLTTGGELLVLDSINGSPVGKQKLERIANTAPLVLGQFLVYGSRNGQIVWHSYRLDSDWRSYQVSNSIQIRPVYSDGYVIAVGSDGRIMNLLARSATQVWSARTLGPVVAPPVAGNGAVYVASLDQHLRAYELSEARSPRWQYLTESPLTEGPVLIHDRVYQQVADEGLVCFDALPLHQPGGKVIWRANDASGSVLTRMRDTLLTWDAAGKRIQLVDDRLGAVIKTTDMPQIDRIIATDVERGDLYATGTDGRIIRLVPRN